MANADLSFGVLGTELWSPAGLGLGRRLLRRLGRHGLLEFAAHALSTVPRLDDVHVRLRRGPRPARAVGAAHGARPRQRGLGVHDPGHRVRRPARRDARAGRRRRPPRRGARGHRPGRGRRPPDERGGRADHGLRRSRGRRRSRRRRDDRRDPRRHRGGDADPALRLAPPRDRRPRRRPRRGGALPLRPRGDADPPRSRRAASVERAGRGAARDRPRSST